MPVTENFYISHQWLRELKRNSFQRCFVGVYFRIPDQEPVIVGHYSEKHRPFHASEAVGLIRSLDRPEGYEVIVPRKIYPAEVNRVRSVPQVVGWRYFPGSHGWKPCGCQVCQPRGAIKSRRLREVFEASLIDYSDSADLEE